MESIRRGSIKPRYEVYDDLNWIVTSPVHPSGLGCIGDEKLSSYRQIIFYKP